MMFTNTTGSSAPAMYDIASAISEMPGLDDDVKQRHPAPAAP